MRGMAGGEGGVRGENQEGELEIKARVFGFFKFDTF